MATILKGAPVVAAMNERNALLCEQLKAKGITPTLAVVRVGYSLQWDTNFLKTSSCAISFVCYVAILFLSLLFSSRLLS